jgi:hypothetical protein
MIDSAADRIYGLNHILEKEATSAYDSEKHHLAASGADISAAI